MRRSPVTWFAPTLFLALVALPAPSARGEDAPPVVAPAPAATPASTLALKTDRVVVFKDGYALFAKTGRAVADAAGRVYTEAVPDGAVLGCFWAVAEQGAVLGLRAAWVETTVERDREESCLSTVDVLRANVGRRVVLGVTRAGAADINGTIVGLLEAPPVAPPPPPTRPRPTGPAGTTVTPVERVGGGQVVVDTGGSRLVLNVAEIDTVAGPDLVTRIVRHERITTKAKRLAVDLGADAAGKPAVVRLFYFTEGLRWIPTYRVTGALEADARVSLTGEVLNEAEDLEDAALDLVVGVPSFRFRDVLSPLTLETTMHVALAQTEQSLRGQRAQMFSNYGANLATNNDAEDEGDAAGAAALATAPSLAKDAQADLFVYGLGHVGIARGERAALSLWESTATLRHLYTLDLAVARDHRSGASSYRSAKQSADFDAGRGDPSSGRSDAGAPVWHEIELANASTVPWTTGAALVLRGEVPIAQNMLRYTSPGAKTLLPLTVAVDVQGKWEEVELERQPNTLRWGGETFSVIKKRGTVTVVNRRKEATSTRVTVGLGGRVTTATEGGKVTVNDVRAADWPAGSYAVNNHSDVVWELTLAPGETKQLGVEFGFYVN